AAVRRRSLRLSLHGLRAAPRGRSRRGVSRMPAGFEAGRASPDSRNHAAALAARSAVLPRLLRERPAADHAAQHRQRESRALDEVLLGHDRELRGGGDDPRRAEVERLRRHRAPRARRTLERVYRRQAGRLKKGPTVSLAPSAACWTPPARRWARHL